MAAAAAAAPPSTASSTSLTAPSLLSVQPRLVPPIRRRHTRDKPHAATRVRRSRSWKKLLWVRQSYPDNYTDPPTFLSSLRRNHRLVPYDFWTLVADSTVIVQHVCSVAIFVCCFVGIYQARLSPLAVVGSGSILAVLGWIVFDVWSAPQDDLRRAPPSESHSGSSSGTIAETASDVQDGSVVSREPPPIIPSIETDPPLQGLGLSLPTASRPKSLQLQVPNISTVSLPTLSSAGSVNRRPLSMPALTPPLSAWTLSTTSLPLTSISPRNQQRLATIKSAILIYCALLGLSPILKSLTKSTTSDSIWAISSALMLVNVFSFDYSGGVGVKFPASLSTNAALMSSTVLASRLTGTTHVFSLTLFSIEVFGLFPVFRRHLRHQSWTWHLALTAVLIVLAGAGLGVTLVGGPDLPWSWRAALVGSIAGSAAMLLTIGGCSWWLIGLQKYKNVVTGPWDPARPVLRAGDWD